MCDAPLFPAIDSSRVVVEYGVSKVVVALETLLVNKYINIIMTYAG